jgi:hypothetical protein
MMAMKLPRVNFRTWQRAPPNRSLAYGQRIGIVARLGSQWLSTQLGK